MRLIDADVYAAEMRKKQENCRAWKDSLDRESETYARAEQSLVTFIEAVLTLKSQPTIAAIPVEWLQQKMFNADAVGAWYTVDTIKWLIEMWKKEQEVQK